MADGGTPNIIMVGDGTLGEPALCGEAPKTVVSTEACRRKIRNTKRRRAGVGFVVEV